MSAFDDHARQLLDLLQQLQTSLQSLLQDVAAERQESAAAWNALSAQVTELTAQSADLQKQIDQLKTVPTPQPIPSPPPGPGPTPGPVDAAATVELQTRETAGVPRRGEIACMGVPLPEALNVEDTGTLAVQDDSGHLVPADFRPTAWWRSAQAPKGIQWVNVAFPVDHLAAHGERSYKLLIGVKKGTNPAPARPLTVAPLGGDTAGYRVDTGAAQFVVTPAGVVAEMAAATQENVVAGATTEANISDKGDKGDKGGKRATTSGMRGVSLEYCGPLVANLVVETTFPDLRFGGGLVSVRRRYELRAGCPVALIGERVAWEGTLNGTSEVLKDGSPNAVLGTLVREKVRLKAAAAPKSVAVFYRRDSPPARFEAPRQDVALAQNLRPTRLMPNPDNPTKQVAIPLSFTLSAGGTVAVSGTEADAGMMVVHGEQGDVVVALRQMHRYEPQALRYSPADAGTGNAANAGEIDVDLAADKFWLAHHQGLYVNFAIGVLPPQSTADDAAGVWGVLNRPLRGMPSAAWINGAKVLPEIPAGDLPAHLARWDDCLRSICDNTMTKMVQEGLQGLMTFGSWPRYWGQWGVGTGETGDGTWDATFLKTNWTDYWCTTKIAVEKALRSGEPEWLDELAFPGAWRMLHTQILQGAPEDTWFYLGQTAYGYGAFRADFNSSHQYWENLYFYYFLTGDPTVVETIERGARAQVKFIRAQGSVSGRQPHQWVMAIRFLANTSQDPSWGAVFEELMTRAVKDYYLPGTWNGQPVAFWTTSPPKGAGTVQSVQHFSLGFYDMENLYWFGVRNGNAPVGPRNVKPWDVLTGVAKTVSTLGMSVMGGDGSVRDRWSRAFDVTLDANGNVTGLAGATIDTENLLYSDDKPALASFLARAALLSGDEHLQAVAADLVQLAFDRIAGGDNLPMCKLIGMDSARVGAAVAWEAGQRA
ncbi:MAG: hypothetical protein QOJ16_1075 [Acidobacteriota bacterium]|jgi:hypothetical protein|nr:hypothetical protein [Acidobacteriota bacterium]